MFHSIYKLSRRSRITHSHMTLRHAIAFIVSFFRSFKSTFSQSLSESDLKQYLLNVTNQETSAKPGLSKTQLRFNAAEIWNMLLALMETDVVIC